MVDSNDQILKDFLETASEDECWRAINFLSDEIPIWDGFLPIRLSHNGATKEILIDPKQIDGLKNSECRKIALNMFNKELKVDRKL